MRSSSVIAAALACACACGESTARVDAGAFDAGAFDSGVVAVPDAEVVADTGVVSISEVRLTDGRTFRGEHVATYDHRLWWVAPSEETTLAFFDPQGFAERRADRSLTMISAAEIAEMRDEHAVVISYRDFLRANAIVIAQSPLAVPAYVFNGNESYHLQEDGYGDFAWDLVIIDAAGSTYAGTGFANEDYYIWGQDVRSPVAGEVVEVFRDAPDRLPGPIADYTAQNNLIGIHAGGAYTVYVLHMQQGSIPAELVPGSIVERGDLIGRVGNSGVSIAPHVHLTVLWWNELDGRYWSAGSEFANIYTSTTGSGAVHHAYAVPATGTWIASSPF